MKKVQKQTKRLKKNRVIAFIASLCLLGLNSCASKIPDEVEVVIISTNDIHGHFDHLAKLSTFVKETRAQHKNVIVVDAGDRFTGNPFNDYFEKNQFPIVDLMNYIGFDVLVLGNHEFDFGVDLLNERIKESNGATIMANIDLKSSGLKGVKPYHIVKKEGVKVAFLGLCNVEKLTGIPAVLAKKVEGITFFDPIETAMKFRHLREKSNVFIALTHIGIFEDRVLADSMPELDLIISGHSHSVLHKPEVINGVPIIQAERHGHMVGKTIIRLEKGVVTSISYELIDIHCLDIQADPVVLEKIRVYEDNPYLKEPFVTLTYDIPDFRRLGYLVTDASREALGTDFSLINCSGIRIEFLPAGPITPGDIIRLSPFQNYLVAVEKTPQQLREILEYVYKVRPNKCVSIPSGFEFTMKRISSQEIRVEKLTYPNGELLDENKLYSIALGNFLYAAHLHGGHFTEEDLRKADEMKEQITIVDAIINYLKKNPDVDYQNAGLREHVRN
jgi:2',3'-cyclic-nucleotide 2'-phosphodiesterase (5'-nucleotidase family)